MPSRVFHSARPLVLAHRGGSHLAPENTMAAFDHALALGADGIELDVRLSRDGVVVVYHDESLDRTTHIRGAVADFTAGELARVDASRGFRGAIRAEWAAGAVGIPTLEAVLLRHRECVVVVEMKEDTVSLAAAVVEVIRRTGAGGRACLGAFGSRALRAARELAPELDTSASRAEVRWALYRSWCRWPIRRAAYQGYQVPECSGSTRVVSARFVREARRAGLGVQVWTVNEEADARRLLDMGVQAIITDRPDRMLPLVRC